MSNPELLFSLALRVSLLFASGLALSTALRRASASHRRLVLLLTFSASLALALVVWGMPERPIARIVPAPAVGRVVAEALSGAPALEPNGASVAAPAPSISGSTLGSLVVLAWLAGAAALLARLAHGLMRAEGLIQRALPLAPGIRHSREVEGPMVASPFRPTIVLPLSAAAWDDERKRLVLSHEWAHVKRRDGLALLVAELGCVLYWFHPLAWVARRALRRECELAADEAVLAEGVRATSYAGHLLGVARALRVAPGSIGMAARPSELARRIETLVARDSLPAPLDRRRTFAFVSVAALALGLVCSAASIQAAPHEPWTTEPRPLPRVQSLVRDAADRARREWSATRVAIVVLDATTGAVLGEHDDQRGAQITPASTLKPITAAIALDAGRITLDQRFDGGKRSYGSFTLSDATAYGALDLASVLAVSSNVGASRILDAAGGRTLRQGLERFRLPPPGEIREDSFDGALIAIGQRFRTTPLALARAYAVFANDGDYVHADSTGAIRRERVISPASARALRNLLEGAVSGERATGRAARIAGVRVAGKTGSSQGDRVLASFAGLLPAEKPRLVIYVGIESNDPNASGGLAAAPIFAALGRQLLATGP